MNDWGVSDRAAAIHRDAVVWDMTFPLMDPGPPEQRYGPLARMAESGYDFVSLTVALDWDGVAETLAAIARERAWLRANADRYVLVETVDDIDAARQQGKLAVGFHFQGTNPVDYDVDMVEVYYKLGVRHMLIAYNARNAAGDGWFEPNDGGLSRFGVRLIETMNRVGMMVDATHTGYRTTMEMFEVSRDPVVFTHSNPRALHDHGRNIRDDQIKACARSGGVIGLNGVSLFLGGTQASPEALADHVQYVADLVGARHVGLGLDYVFDQLSLAATINSRRAWTPPDESFADQPQETVTYLQPEQLPRFTEILLERGYSEDDVRGILGENWMRVARQVWK
ncbi:MAG: membrane dipeptidase [Immundisolibacterales bacterium]|nr:membrane dipeptidase [Immundisolibacterales bacterium]